MKQFLSSIVLTVAVATLAAPAAAVDFTPTSCGGSPFSDVQQNHPLCGWIDQLDADQISGGCGGGNYCPDGPVTRAQLARLLEKAMRGTATWDPWRGAYRRTLIANQILTGNPPQPDAQASGQRLVALLGEISGNGPSNPYLLRLEPGIFDLGTATLTLKPFVDVEGSGQGVTVIRSAGSGAVVAGADDAEVRFLTVQHTGGAASSIALDLSADATRLTHVHAVAGGANSLNRAINAAGDGVVLREVSASVTAPAGANAIAIYATGDVVMHQVTAQAQGGASSAGIVATTGALLLQDVSVTATGATSLYGVSLETGASAVLRRVDASATNVSPGTTAVALNLLDGDARVEGGTYLALAGTSYGVLCTQLAGTHAARIRNARVAGLGHSIQADSGYEVYVGDSQLSGGAVEPNGGTVTCFGAYDSEFTNTQLDVCP